MGEYEGKILGYKIFDKGFIVTFVLFMVVYSFISTVSPLLSALYLPIKTILLIGAAIAAIGGILIFMATGKDTSTHNQKEENNQI
ncbi:hypothetical protein [Butyrivibrio sp. VCD2006]|uniref:hypothetical protein n=1 Tax=Butyrivibrio sp. VCD2006 TaxID=1280664 RepID=UPI00040CDBCB|nr:hypothetical protein [Butyrivibrio sp. VCD2006]